jgi:hypothetical protein
MEEGVGRASAPVAVPSRRADPPGTGLPATVRSRAHGKFLDVGDEKLYFAARPTGHSRPTRSGCERQT